MNLKSNTYTYLSLYFFTTLAILWFLPYISWSPNSYLFATDGDGLNPYYLINYYTKYGKGWYFEGMQYPYGVHTFYMADVLWLKVFHWINSHICDISPYTDGILNSILLLSFYPAVYFMYKILRFQLISEKWAVGFSIFIVFFSPHIERLGGMTNLSYPFFIPAIIYYLLQIFYTSNKIKYQAILLIILILGAFIHLYHTFIGATICFLFILFHAIQNHKNVKSNISIYVSSLFSTFFVFVIIAFTLYFTVRDANDGITYPYGFRQYTSTIRNIFLPFYSPISDFLVTKCKVESPNTEGLGYVGIFGLGIALFSVIRWVRKIKKWGWKKGHNLLMTNALHILLWVGFFLFIGSTGYPFKLHPYLMQILGPVKNFRVPGRFIWGFYFIYMTFFALTAYQIYRKINSTLLKNGLVFLVSIICFWEMQIRFSELQKQYIAGKENGKMAMWKENYETFLKKNNYKSSDFQAIIVFPFFQMGSGKFQLEFENESKRLAYAVSKSTGLPICDAHTGRNPLSIAMKSVEWINSPYLEKHILKDINDKRPLLLIQADVSLDSLQLYYAQKAKTITKMGNMRFATLSIEEISKLQDSVLQVFTAKTATYSFQNEIFISSNKEKVYSNGFGNKYWENGKIAENNVFWYNRMGKKMVIDLPLTPVSQPTEMIASVWIKVDTRYHYLPDLYPTLSKNDQILQDSLIVNIHNIDFYEGWVKADWHFWQTPEMNRLKIETKDEYISLDNLLIRPKGTEVCKKINSKLFIYNNLPIKLP